jgi:hypothetical protein
MARLGGMLAGLGLGVLNMSDVDWLALWVEFAQATDNKQIEVAERIVYFDGRLDFTELSRSTLLSTARQIIRQRVEKSWGQVRPFASATSSNPSNARGQAQRHVGGRATAIFYRRAAFGRDVQLLRSRSGFCWSQ